MPILMSQLPLQIRKDVRDVFEANDSLVQVSFHKLAEVIGYPVSCAPEWHMLWSELESSYPDRSTFVPSVSKVTEVWSQVLAKRLESEKYEDWTETLLERLKPAGAVRILVQVSVGAAHLKTLLTEKVADTPRITTKWSIIKSAFAVTLPKQPVLEPFQAASAFAGDLETIFHASGVVEDVQPQEDEDWADLTSHADSMSLHLQAPHIEGHQREVQPLPSLQTLPRPEILFQTMTPYLMQVSTSGAGKATVNGTHEASLRLLAEYLQRWIKTDPRDIRKIPYLQIKLHESKFGLGLFHDSLTIEPLDHHQRAVTVNVTLILAFIQGVLGYQPVPQTSGAGCWEFQRSQPFATS